MITKRNLLAEFDTITEHWSPRIIGQVNDQYIKVAKGLGELTWHKHDDEDELFQVVRGRLRIQFENEVEVVLDEGDFVVVPRNTLHNPVADEECWFVLIETTTTKHTGDVETARTRSIEEQHGPF